jgi:hypothetical protein
MEHGLVGSPEWWAAAQAGRIATGTFIGEITEVIPFETRGYPMIGFRIGDQEESCDLLGEPGRYQVGDGILVHYAMVSPKDDYLEIGPHKFVFEIWVQRAGEAT